MCSIMNDEREKLGEANFYLRPELKILENFCCLLLKLETCCVSCTSTVNFSNPTIFSGSTCEAEKSSRRQRLL